LTARSADDLLAAARSQIRRVEPDELERLHAEGALVVDIRPAAQRAAEGALGFGLIVERNVLEWRFDLTGGHTLPEVNGYDQTVVVVCSEGYASSLAAASLRELGFAGAGDLSGGHVAWRRWRDADTAVDDPGATRQPTRGIPGPPPPVHRSTAASRGESGSPVNRAGVTTA
jgi:rhodanese-related sulfurtransferase